MKIIFSANAQLSRTMGLSRCFILLGEALQRQGHIVRFLMGPDVGGCRGGKGLSLLTFPMFVIKPLVDLVRREGDCDIACMHTLAAWAYVALRKVFRWLPPCVIYSCGDDTLRWRKEEEEERLGYRRLGWKAKIFYYNLVIRPSRFALRHADHIVTPVTSEKDFYVGQLGIREERVSVVPSGVPSAFFQERKFRARPDKLLYVGGWEWRKGIRYLIDAFGLISEAYPYVSLTLAGVGLDHARIAEQFPEDLRERVIVIPYLPEQEVPRLYMNHDIFLFPSLFEAMALVLLEAMASAMPVVTTNTCGMKDAVEDGISGFLIPQRDASALADRTAQFLKNPDLCQRLGTAAQQRARELSWESAAIKVMSVFKQASARR